jgi:hypothetical protein
VPNPNTSYFGLSGAALAIAVAANCFDGTSLHSLFAQCFFIRVFRLLVHKGVTTVIVARKICRRRLTTKVAIDALIIHVKAPSSILRILICNVSHILLSYLLSDFPVRLSQISLSEDSSKAR